MADGDLTLPKWATHTLSAAAGAMAMVVGITIWFSSVQHTAGAALQRAQDNAADIDNDIRPRLRILEISVTESKILLAGIDITLKKIEEKLDGNSK